jgi:hypothetical protein
MLTQLRLPPPSLSPSPTLHLSQRGLQQLHMLFRMRLLHVQLRHLLHHEIRIDVHFLTQLSAFNAPLARNSEDADRRLGVDKGIDAGRDVCEG